MRNIYTIETFTFENNKLSFILNESVADIQLQPAKQMIADSDNYAFVYLLDDGEAYSYLRFPQVIWPQLVQVLTLQQDPYLQVGEHQIVLDRFFEELQMLVLNIEGNDNYGRSFTETVEQTFTSILTHE